MAEALTVERLIERMMQNVGIPWQSQRADGFGDGLHLGSLDTIVTGVVTTFTPTWDVLKRSQAAGKNTVICRETPFYSRGERTPVAYRNGPPPPKELLEKDETAREKHQFIDANKLVIIRLADNWDPRSIDAQLKGLANAIGWQKNHIARNGAAGEYRRGNEYFSLAPIKLGELAANLKAKLRGRGIRVIGDPQTPVSKAALTHGFLLVADVQRVMKEPGVEVLVGGEPVEWEASEYFEDLIAARMAKGLILLGNQLSEEPGSGEVAAWLKSFVTEVPVEWIPAGEPFRTVG